MPLDGTAAAMPAPGTLSGKWELRWYKSMEDKYADTDGDSWILDFESPGTAFTAKVPGYEVTGDIHFYVSEVIQRRNVVSMLMRLVAPSNKAVVYKAFSGVQQVVDTLLWAPIPKFVGHYAEQSGPQGAWLLIPYNPPSQQ